MAHPSEATLPPEPTLDEIRLFLSPLIADAACFDGWGDAAVASAAQQASIEPAVAQLAFPGGAMDLIAAWVERTDADMILAFPPEVIGGLKIRERIRTLVQFRLDAALGREEALRRALAIQAMPQNLFASLRQGWRSADLMWRLAGDTATDYNHYTKRTLLAGVYAATSIVLLDDQSEGLADTRGFLDRRIEGVMRFEKVKAQFVARTSHRPSLSRFLGRLRYPAV